MQQPDRINLSSEAPPKFERVVPGLPTPQHVSLRNRLGSGTTMAFILFVIMVLVLVVALIWNVVVALFVFASSHLSTALHLQSWAVALLIWIVVILLFGFLMGFATARPGRNGK